MIYVGRNGQAEKLTVLHVFSGDLWAGAEVMIYTLLKRLKNDPALQVLALSLNHGTLTSRLQDIGVETHVIPESHANLFEIFRQARRLLKGWKIDLIHAHRYKENILAWLLAKSLGNPRLVTTLHGFQELPNHYGSLSLTLKTKLNYALLKLAFTHVVAVSKGMRDTLIQHHGFDSAQVEMIYNGIEIPEPPSTQSKNTSHDGPFHIGTVGRMVPVKDFDLFLEVAAGIKQRLPGVRISLLGDGPMKAQLMRKAQALDLEESVTWHAPRPDPLPYYRSIDLYLNTSRHEGLPLSILEAMACGKPVVAPMVGGIPEIVSHQKTGWLINDRNPVKFVDACLTLFHDRALRATISTSASHAVVSRFSDARMASSYREVYRKLREHKHDNNEIGHDAGMVHQRDC